MRKRVESVCYREHATMSENPCCPNAHREGEFHFAACEHHRGTKVRYDVHEFLPRPREESRPSTRRCFKRTCLRQR